MKLIMARPRAFARNVRVGLREKPIPDGTPHLRASPRAEAQPSFAATRPEPQAIDTGR